MSSVERAATSLSTTSGVGHERAAPGCAVASMGAGSRDPRGSTITVMIVAEVRLYREGLTASLQHREHLSVVATSADRIHARSTVRECTPDVVVVDVATRDSLELIREVRREAPDTKVLAFGVDEVTSDILGCAEAGAAGYVSADASIDDLVVAIERITRRELVCSPRVAATLFACISERSAGLLPGRPDTPTLTNRERQVLGFIRRGHSNKEIALELNIAEPTVKNHVHHLLEKLEVTTRGQAAARSAPATRGRAFEHAKVPNPEPNGKT